MLEELLNNIELVAIAVVLLLIVAFVVYKISSKKSSEELIEDDLEEVKEDEIGEKALLEDEYDEQQETVQEERVTPEEPTEEKQTDLMDLEPQGMGSEEGDFGVIEEETVTEEEVPQTKTIQKREVPPHGKITKDSFQEFSGQRILLAEDNLINQKVILGLLADSGIEVIVANDGQEALSILQNDSNFIIILMDAHMPNIDGFEATRRIRATPEYDHIVVVALSGDTASDDIRKMTEAGMSEHLEKPLKMDALYDILYAYSGNQEEQSSDDEDMVNVVTTRELDGERGLEICGGDETFYHEILSEFLETYSDSDQTLISLLENNELKKADKLLLDIIGVSANIGAVKLHNVATYIKDSIADDEEKSYLTLLQQYQHHLNILLEDIKEYQK
ncbi:response regulator [Sulfurimonas microaerophilic]|uniref:response regulator n=1 Tax=Sulfurimonas microaerophilic TaxID=3058392 RepID=UPI0027148DD3|nr:response regulator [Sulfurimonas sp. hsl 1-7]